jgi:hypothetical protein
MATRDAKENADKGRIDAWSILAAQTVEGGNMVATTTASGDIRAAADTANFLVKGIIPSSEGTFTATADTDAPVLSGVAVWMDNDGTNPVTLKGEVCYVKTSASVCAAAGSSNSIVAGTVLRIDTTLGVLVWIPSGGHTS